MSVAGLVSFITIPLFGYLSDVIGRKTMYMLGIAVMAVWGFVYFGLYATAVPIIVFIAIAVSLIPHDMQYGPQASLIAESFTGRLRYSGASLGYQFASIIAGGPAPSIALSPSPPLTARRCWRRGSRSWPSWPRRRGSWRVGSTSSS